MDASAGFLDLHGETILVHADAGNPAAVARGDANHHEAFGRGLARIREVFAQIRSAALRAYFRKLRTEAGSRAAYDMASRATLGRVKGTSMLGVARKRFGRNPSQRSDISCHLPDFTFGHLPCAIHRRSRHAILNEL